MMIIDLGGLRASCKQRGIPLISIATQQFLIQWCQEHRPMMICEIGAAVGYSACLFQSLISDWGGQVVSVESSFPHYQEAVQNVSTLAYSSGQLASTIYYGLALCLPWDRLVTRPIDLLFVDARKSEYGEYVRYFEPMMSSQGVIICDDVVKFRHKMKGLYDYVDKMQIKVEILQLDEDDGIMIITK